MNGEMGGKFRRQGWGAMGMEGAIRGTEEQPGAARPQAVSSTRSLRDLVCLFVLVASYEVTVVTLALKPWGATEEVRSQHLSFLRRSQGTGDLRPR